MASRSTRGRRSCLLHCLSCNTSGQALKKSIRQSPNHNQQNQDAFRGLIAILPGDGIGEEVTTQSVRVIENLNSKYDAGLTFEIRRLVAPHMINTDIRYRTSR